MRDDRRTPRATADPAEGKTHRVMLVDQAPGRAAILEQALRDHGCEVVCRVGQDAFLPAEVERFRPDIVIIDAESPDRDTLEHVASVNREQPKPVLMFADASDNETIQAAVRAGVSAYVVDGFDPRRLRPIMDVAIARFREYQALRRELEETRTKLADRKDVDRAKGLLMERKALGEEAAYKALRKMAMDRNQSIGEVARNLLAVAALLD
jgi:response regulator NasT